MSKHKSDLVILSNLHLSTPTCWRKTFYALKPYEDSEACRRGREVHEDLERYFCPRVAE